MSPGAPPEAQQLTAWFSAALRSAGIDGEALVSADAAGTPVVDVPAAAWVAAATCARDQMGMDFLDWLSAVDEPEAEPAGLDVVLHLAATDSFGIPARAVRRLLLRTHVAENNLSLPSLTGLWPGVAWHERETFEMFGLGFAGFQDGTTAGLRPLLLPDGFEGTPLRKSFVLAARAAKQWPGAKDPGDSGGRAPARRKNVPPGVPDPSWGPREPGAPREEAPVSERPRRERPARATLAGAPTRTATVRGPAGGRTEASRTEASHKEAPGAVSPSGSAAETDRPAEPGQAEGGPTERGA